MAAEIIHAHSWHYNEVVGWLSLQGYHDGVKIYLWWTTARRLVRLPRHRQFEADGMVTEIWIHDDENSVIGDRVRQGLVEALAADQRMHRRYADLRTFDTIAPHLDWRASLEACENLFSDQNAKLLLDQEGEDPDTGIRALLDEYEPVERSCDDPLLADVPLQQFDDSEPPSGN